MQGSLDRINVLVAGADGDLGSLIVKELFKYNHITVYGLGKHLNQNKELCEAIGERGGKTFTVDLMDAASLRGVTKGIHTIVSAIEGDEDVIYRGQMDLLEDAIKNGVKRFVPANFTVDFERCLKHEETFLISRQKFDDELRKSSVKGLFITTGMFMDTYLDMCTDGVTYWGHESTTIDLISREDAAKFIAAAVAQPDRVGHLSVTGISVRIADLPPILEKVLGKKIELIQYGSVTDLRKKAVHMKNKGETEKAAKYFYAIHAFDGKGKIHKDQNSEFPNIHPMSLEDYIKAKLSFKS